MNIIVLESISRHPGELATAIAHFSLLGIGVGGVESDQPLSDVPIPADLADRLELMLRKAEQR